MGSLRLDPFVVAVIVGMAAVTYATKAGGLLLLSRLNVSDRTEDGLEVLPGAIIISILGPELTSDGPPEWGAAAVVLFVMWRRESILLALLCGVITVLTLRAVL